MFVVVSFAKCDGRDGRDGKCGGFNQVLARLRSAVAQKAYLGVKFVIWKTRIASDSVASASLKFR